MRITLCGSGKYESQYHQLNMDLSLRGHVVYGMAVYASQMGGVKDWYTDSQKVTLDHVHKMKILNSEGIVVINNGGYVGDSTESEIQYAQDAGKRVFWLEPPNRWDRNVQELLTPTGDIS